MMIDDLLEGSARRKPIRHSARRAIAFPLLPGIHGQGHDGVRVWFRRGSHAGTHLCASGVVSEGHPDGIRGPPGFGRRSIFLECRSRASRRRANHLRFEGLGENNNNAPMNVNSWSRPDHTWNLIAASSLYRCYHTPHL